MRCKPVKTKAGLGAEAVAGERHLLDAGFGCRCRMKPIRSPSVANQGRECRHLNFMADIIFDCPACKQPVQADDAWAGQEIQCPLCHAPMIVPGAPPTAHELHYTGKQLVEVPKENKLKAGATQTARSSAGSGAVIRNFQKPVAKKQNPVVKYGVTVLVLAALGIGGWLGWPYLKPHLPFLKSEETAAADNPAAKEGSGAGEAASTAEAAVPPAPPPVKEAPMTPPVYTLDVAQAKISEGKANGTITGLEFVPDTEQLEKLPGVYVLDLRQGTGATPDRGLRVYLRLTGTNTPAGQSWTVTPDMKGTPVSQVVKSWKTNPKYAAQERAFSTGFALKLEFGQVTESNTIPGKLFVALPDKEKSVVGGVFLATSSAFGAAGETPQAVPAAPAALPPEYQRRYGLPGRR